MNKNQTEIKRLLHLYPFNLIALDEHKNSIWFLYKLKPEIFLTEERIHELYRQHLLGEFFISKNTGAIYQIKKLWKRNGGSMYEVNAVKSFINGDAVRTECKANKSDQRQFLDFLKNG